MTFSPFDSPIYSTLYGDAEVRTLFTDSAEVRAMLLVEGTLAPSLQRRTTRPRRIVLGRY